MINRTDHGLIIAPETDGVLLRLTRRVDPKPGWNLGSTPEAIALCGDKLATSRHLVRHGLLIPEAFRLNEFGGSIGHEGLFVLKPYDGAGTIDTFLVPGPAVQAFASHSLADPSRFHCLRFVPGTSAGFSFLCDGHGSATPVAACRHDVRYEPVQSGVFRFLLDTGSPAPVPDEERSESVVKAIRTIPGLRGWVGVDVILDPKGKLAAILEINPRLTSSFVWALNRTSRSQIASAWLASSEVKRL